MMLFSKKVCFLKQKLLFFKIGIFTLFLVYWSIFGLPGLWEFLNGKTGLYYSKIDLDTRNNVKIKFWKMMLFSKKVCFLKQKLLFFKIGIFTLFLVYWSTFGLPGVDVKLSVTYTTPYIISYWQFDVHTRYMNPIYHYFGILKMTSLSTHIDKSIIFSIRN